MKFLRVLVFLFVFTFGLPNKLETRNAELRATNVALRKALQAMTGATVKTVKSTKTMSKIARERSVGETRADFCDWFEGGSGCNPNGKEKLVGMSLNDFQCEQLCIGTHGCCEFNAETYECFFNAQDDERKFEWGHERSSATTCFIAADIPNKETGADFCDWWQGGNGCNPNGKEKLVGMTLNDFQCEQMCIGTHGCCEFNSETYECFFNEQDDEPKVEWGHARSSAKTCFIASDFPNKEKSIGRGTVEDEEAV